MSITKRTRNAGILILAVSACSTPLTSTITNEDLAEIQALNTAIEDLAVDTNPGDVPDNGTATYSGYMTTSAGNDSNIVGDLNLTADFDAGTVSGTADNINLLLSPNPDVNSQSLAGSLNVSNGTITGTAIAADLTGNLSGVASGLNATLSADLDLNGEIMSSSVDGTSSDIITGGITGDIDVFLAGSLQDTLTFEPDDLDFVVCTVDCNTLVP